MIGVLRATVSRIVGAIVAAVAAFLVARFGLELGPDFVTATTEAGTILVMAVLMLVYGIVHKLIDRSVNPQDRAA